MTNFKLIPMEKKIFREISFFVIEILEKKKRFMVDLKQNVYATTN